MTFFSNDKNKKENRNLNLNINKYNPKNLQSNNIPFQNTYRQNINQLNYQKDPYTFSDKNNFQNKNLSNTLEPKIYSNKIKKNSLDGSMNNKKEEYEEYLNSISKRSSKDKFYNNNNRNIYSNNQNFNQSQNYEKNNDYLNYEVEKIKGINKAIDILLDNDF